MTPEQFVAVLGAITALVVALGAIFVQLRQTHTLVNGQAQQLRDMTGLAAQKQGELAGRDFADAAATSQTRPTGKASEGGTGSS